MFNQKQINIEEYKGNKTILFNFMPVAKNIGTKTFIYNLVSVYSKLNEKKRCLIIDTKDELKNKFRQEKSINNVKVHTNPNFENILYVTTGNIVEKAGEMTLLNLLVKKLDVDIIFVKNNNMTEKIHYKKLNERYFLQKNFLMTDLDSEITLLFYKELMYSKIRNNGTIVLNIESNDMFKTKKMESLLNIKNYSKVLCKSSNYGIIKYNEKKGVDLFKDITSVNETDIYLEYEDNLNLLLGKPIKGFGTRWLKRKS